MTYSEELGFDKQSLANHRFGTFATQINKSNFKS